MHWVVATTPEGHPAFINLAATCGMMRANDVTVLFLGGVAIGPGPDGKPIVEYARTLVKETPEQLFSLPEVSAIVRQAAVKQAIVAQADAARSAAKAPAPAQHSAAPAPVPAGTFPDPGATPNAPRRDRFKQAKAARKGH